MTFNFGSNRDDAWGAEAFVSTNLDGNAAKADPVSSGIKALGSVKDVIVGAFKQGSVQHRQPAPSKLAAPVYYTLEGLGHSHVHLPEGFVPKTVRARVDETLPEGFDPYAAIWNFDQK